VRDSNGPMIAAYLRKCGCRERPYGIVPDEREALRSRLQQALGENDAVLLSGGSSKDERDLTAVLIGELGEVLVHGIAIAPGKPTVIGKCRGRPVIGLPGHPASALVVLDRVARPLLAALSGDVSKAWEHGFRSPCPERPLYTGQGGLRQGQAQGRAGRPPLRKVRAPQYPRGVRRDGPHPGRERGARGRHACRSHPVVMRQFSTVTHAVANVPPCRLFKWLSRFAFALPAGERPYLASLASTPVGKGVRGSRGPSFRPEPPLRSREEGKVHDGAHRVAAESALTQASRGVGQAMTPGMSQVMYPKIGFPVFSAKAISDRVPYLPPTAMTASALSTTMKFRAWDIPVLTWTET